MEPERIAVSVAEAAQMIGISVPKAYALVKSGQMPAKRVGKRWVVPVDKLKEWVME